MYLSRTPWRKPLHAVLSILVSASLMLALAPRVSARAMEAEARWSDSIDEMLASGDYVEGEAVVALFGAEDDALQAQAELPVDALEPLMEVSADAAGVQDGPGLTAQAERDVTLTLVTSDALSAEELLRALADDPRVAFAEPNYTIELASQEEEQATLPSDDVALVEEPSTVDELPTVDEAPTTEAEDDTSQPDADPEPLTIVSQADGDIADLRQLQWGNWDTSSFGTKALDATGNVSINVPNFETAQVGANMDNEVVVAVLDGAVDFNNPDLKDRAYTFSPELQEQLGCDVHGFNASAESTDGKIVNRLDSDGDNHGTHCAGIIGATWDGRGVSGVASNVKIVSIQMMDVRPGEEEDNGKTSVADGLRGFDFVKRANEAGVGIKVTSNSWNHYQSSKALNAAILELGKTQGVVTVFAASNDRLNNDLIPITTNTFVDNPYVITVAATNQFDTIVKEYNYGENTVDIAAPGMPILSTVTPAQASYIPAALPESNILYEEFEGSAPVVTIQQIDVDGNYVSSRGAPCSDVHLMGKQGVAVPIDPDYATGESMLEDSYRTLRFDFDLAAAQEQTGVDVVASLKAAQDLYFAFGLCVGREYDDTEINYLMTNASGDEPLWSFDKDTLRGGVLANITATLTDDDVSFDFDGLDGHLIIDVVTIISEGCDVIYMDSVGIGTQKVPYAFLQGTSMACPAVSGAAAVLSSREGLEGAELASRVRSMVRIPDEGPFAIRTGGVFDFTVQGSSDNGEETAFGPSIQSVELSGTTVTITGSNFGSDSGSVEIARYVVFKEDEVCASKVSSWSDSKVTVELASPFEGILTAKLTNAAGKQDTDALFVSKGEAVYEQDLPFTSDTGEPFVFDGLGDYETRGPLVGLGCKLYYLPADQRTELSPVHQHMLRFDLKTEKWSEMPPLPEMLQGASAVIYEGKLIVEGATVQILPSGEPTSVFVGGEPEERVYVFDPATSSWSQASSEGMYVGQTIVNDGGQLKLVGATRWAYDEEWGQYTDMAVPVCSYDLDKGLVEELSPLAGYFKDPDAVAKDGVLYIVDYTYSSLMVVKEGNLDFYSWILPSGVLFDIDDIVQRGVLVISSEGPMLVGPPAADGSSDTYILREGDGDVQFVPYEKRASEARVSSVAACTYRGRLFAIGSSWAEPNQRLFRATAVGVPEYPGDIPCDKDSEPTPTPEPAPTPARVLPKTSDPTVPTPVLVGVGLCGVVAVVAGVVLRRKNH